MTTQTEYKALFSVAEAATYLGVSPSTVRRLAKDFHITQRYIGARMLITTESLEAFVEVLPPLPDPEFWD